MRSEQCDNLLMASTEPRAMHADSPSQGAMGRSQDASLPSFDATTPSQQLTFTFATGIKNASFLPHYANHLTNYTSTSPLGTRRQGLIAFAARYQTMRLVYPRVSFKHAPMYHSIIICQPNSSLRRDLKLRPWNQLGVSFGYVSQA